MFIVTRHTILNDDIEILNYEDEDNDITYNKCFNCIMDEIDDYKTEHTTIKIINKNFISVYINGFLYGKHHMYNYEIHEYK